MAHVSITIHRKIDQLIRKQQIRFDLPFLLRHYYTLRELGITDSHIVKLFNQGLLSLTLKGFIDGLKD